MDQWSPQEQAIAAEFMNPFRGQMNRVLIELHDTSATPEKKIKSLQLLLDEFVKIYNTELTEKKKSQLNVAMNDVLTLLEEIMENTQ
jgi:hypothetical protein